ncbi:glycosyltransferase family 4 protein [Hyphomicrobium sp. MC8b]|uniref:glycosyltransferase family 4 protein n=1 Tax=Hyphomicrobium sp. MC8b TaxID=300273 RepID=UPI003918FD42
MSLSENRSERLPTYDAHPPSVEGISPNAELISLIQLATWLTRASVLYRMTRKSQEWRERKIHQRALKYGAPVAFAVWWSTKMSEEALIWKLLCRSLGLQRWHIIVEILNDWARGAIVQKSYLAAPEAIGQIAKAEMCTAATPIVLRSLGVRESVLVVVHETSRTGAPILAWNLVEGLRKQYDVVTVRMGDGPLTPEFESISSEVIEWRRDSRSKPYGSLAKRKFKYAIVNSCESREFIEVCRKYSIPTVFLMHEFASYVYAIDSLRAAFDASTEVVFSSTIIERDAIRAHPSLAGRKRHVLPQGRCVIPASYSQQPPKPKVLEELKRAKSSSNVFIVIGAGSVQFRKGVDLFLQTAASVQREIQSRDVQFVWIGKGYNPDTDKQYSVYLKEHILRAKFRLAPIFLDELGDLSDVYSLADVLMLSSRLDPLPNVAIDAAMEGVPIVCFDDASGMADILLENRNTADGVVNYCDTAEAARVISRLAANDSERLRMSDSIRALAEVAFDMKKYIAQLDELGSYASQQAAV